MCVMFQAVGERLYFRFFNAQSICMPLAGACSVRILSTIDMTLACEDIELEWVTLGIIQPAYGDRRKHHCAIAIR